MEDFQGSNLGPLLFLIYINNLPNCLESKGAALFGDDTSFLCHGAISIKLETKLNIDLDHVHNWPLANKLTLNKDKTEYMIIGSRQRLEKIDEISENIALLGRAENNLSDMKLYKLCISHSYFFTLPIVQHFGMTEMNQNLKNS